ncbi:hypothetical protein ACFL6Q_04005 [Candidatus Neomarinimicrobiota bacterium]
MKQQRFTLIFILLGCLVPLVAAEEDKETKIKDTGLGFSLSSGQSIFYSRSIDPFGDKHTYYSLGFHQEEEGIGVVYYNPYLGTYDRISKEKYYLEFGYGWRHLWFKDKMAGEFLPHSSIEVGASAHVKRIGRLVELFKGSSLVWDPYIQIGAGASIFTGQAIYRIEMGYLGTASEWISYLPEGTFPGYQGAYLKMIISSGKKPR